jgi:hypothetical protein
VLVDDLVGVHVLVAGSEELDCEEEGLGFGKAAVAVAEHVHEGTATAEFEGHVDVVVVLVLRGSELALGLLWQATTTPGIRAACACSDKRTMAALVHLRSWGNEIMPV